jgi:hypothetical protein
LGDCGDFAIENLRDTEVSKSLNDPMAQSLNGKDLVIRGQGLRGSDPGVVWCRELAALET